MSDSPLHITLCGVPLRNPVFAASGTFGYGIEFAGIVDLDRLGAIVTKGLSREPILGNPAPRLWHTDAGMINSVGLQNVGVAAFLRDKLPKLRRYAVKVFANVFGYSIEDYSEVIRSLEDADGIAGYELNASCPNTKEGGMLFSSDPALMFRLVQSARRVSSRPLLVKLSPNVAQTEPFAKAAEEAGADAISLVNTVVSLAIDSSTRRARIGAGFGGLSGPAIKPLALRMVHQASQCVRIPIVGLGGISSGRDAAEFLIAGARAVQVGTATFVDPRAPHLVAKQLGACLRGLGVDHVTQLSGSLRAPYSQPASASPTLSAK